MSGSLSSVSPEQPRKAYALNEESGGGDKPVGKTGVVVDDGSGGNKSVVSGAASSDADSVAPIATGGGDLEVAYNQDVGVDPGDADTEYLSSVGSNPKGGGK